MKIHHKILLIGFILIFFCGFASATASFDGSEIDVDGTDNTLASITSDIANTSIIEDLGGQVYRLYYPIDLGTGSTTYLVDGDTLQLYGASNGDVNIHDNYRSELFSDRSVKIESTGAGLGYIALRSPAEKAAFTHTNGSDTDLLVIENMGYSSTYGAVNLQQELINFNYVRFESCIYPYTEVTNVDGAIQHDLEFYNTTGWCVGANDNGKLYNFTIFNSSYSGAIVTSRSGADIYNFSIDGYTGTAIQPKESHSVHIYDGSILNGGIDAIAINPYVNAANWNWDERCIVENVTIDGAKYGFDWTKGPYEIFDCSINDTSFGIYKTGLDSYIYDTYFSNTTSYLIYNNWENTNNNLTIENITSDGYETYTIYTVHDTDDQIFKNIDISSEYYYRGYEWRNVSTINCNVTIKEISSDYAVYQPYYYPNIRVIDQYGNPVVGADLVVTNTVNSTRNGMALDQTIPDSWTTDARGMLPTPTHENKSTSLTLLDVFEDHTGVLETMAYNINVSKDGYYSNSTSGIDPDSTWYSVDITDLNGTEIIIILELEPIPPEWDKTAGLDAYTQVSAILILSLVIGTFYVVIQGIRGKSVNVSKETIAIATLILIMIVALSVARLAGGIIAEL